MWQVCEDRWVLEKGCEGPVEEGEWYCKVNLLVVHQDNNTRPQPAIVQVPHSLLLHQIFVKCSNQFWFGSKAAALAAVLARVTFFLKKNAQTKCTHASEK